MSIYETSITNPRKQLEFYKDLSEQLQQENNQLKLINKEHQQINGELRQANKLLNEQYIRLYKEYEQQERIKYLERSNNRREDIILEQRQEINDLEDNWNMLKEYIRKNIIYDDVGMKILDPSPLEDYMQDKKDGKLKLKRINLGWGYEDVEKLIYTDIAKQIKLKNLYFQTNLNDEKYLIK